MARGATVDRWGDGMREQGLADSVRSEVVDRILAALASGEGPPCLVGVGGTGKTTALEHLAAAVTADSRTVRQCGWLSGPTAGPLAGLAGLLDPADITTALPDGDERGATAVALEALDGADLLLVDDAHLLSDASLRVLAGVTRQRPEIAVVAAARPVAGHDAFRVLGGPRLAETPIVLGPLPDAELAALLTHHLDRPPDSAEVAVLASASGGVPRMAALLAREWGRHGGVPDDPADALSAEVVEVLRGEVDTLGAPARRLLAVLGLEVDAGWDVLAQVVGGPTRATGDDWEGDEADPPVGGGGSMLDGAWSELVAAGLLDPERERLLPVVAAAVGTLLTPAERREVQIRAAQVLTGNGAPAPTTADLFAAARATGPEAAQAHLDAAAATLEDDPAAARRRLDDAEQAGAPGHLVAALRAEVALRDGQVDVAIRLADDALATAPDGVPARALEAGAAALGRAGHWARSAALYERLAAADPDTDRGGRARLLGAVGWAVTGEVAAARPAVEQARTTAAGGPVHLQACLLLAEGVLDSLGQDPEGCLRRLLEAASMHESCHQGPPLPEGATVVAMLVALHQCDFDLARQLGAGARSRQFTGGSPVRLRLLEGWATLRTGAWDETRAVLEEVGPDDVGELSRDELWRHALEVGLARRYGRVSEVVRGWQRAREVLLRTPVDLFSLLPAGELVVAGARVDGARAVGATVASIERLLGNLGEPPLWSLQARWDLLQAALAADDAAEVRSNVAGIVRLADNEASVDVLVDGARTWEHLVAGRIDAEAVSTTVARLHRGGLPWEASRLAGAAAVRCRDPATARQLLGLARQLRSALPAAPSPREEEGPLSEREREIGALVLDGLTHRQIGAQLYISPKTVEHHVASIRRRLGASNRAELLAGLRDLLRPSG